jgi:uncharacterized protein with von Willebrand factor type A (vWA) domain
MLDLIQALPHIDIGRKDDLYSTCRAILVRRREDLPLFDQAWQFWWATRQIVPGSERAQPESRLKSTPVPRRLLHQREQPSRETGEPQSEEVEVRLSFSASEALREKDFAELDGDELEQVRALLALLRLKMARRSTRRRVPGRGKHLDPRRTMRRALRTGGEALTLARRTRKQRQRPLVVLCDISGSMERYSRLLLQFVYSISAGLRDVEAFVFGTRLTRVTRLLRNRDIDEALADVGRHVLDWGGGTRIGEALKEFNFRWGRRVLGHGAIVLLISDGWDRGDPELIRRETARLQRTSHRLIWLNPLLGREGYQPLTRGLQAALPYVDDFMPVHNLNSLEQLGTVLSNIARR